MGITTSKSVNVALSKAITTTSQANANDSRVDRVLFQDPTSAQCLQQAWTELLPPLRKTFVVRNKRSSAKDRALKKVLVDEKIHCHSFVHIHLTKWSVDPSTFLDTTEQHHRTPSSGGQLYQLLTHLTNSVVINQICLRFCLMLFSEWKSHFCQTRLRSAKSLFIDDILQSGFAVGQCRDVIEKMSAAWTSSGARYAQLASDLGGKGCLMLLPDNITPYEWERGLPSSGPDHDKMVASLKKRGICEEATRTNANRVADAVWRYLQSAMESTRSNAKRQRRGGGSQGGPLAVENASECHGASSGPANSPGGNGNSMQDLLTAAEQMAGQIPVLQHPSARRSSIVDQSDLPPPNPRIPFHESPLCNTRWSVSNHTDLFDFNNDPPVATASQQLYDLTDEQDATQSFQQGIFALEKDASYPQETLAQQEQGSSFQQGIFAYEQDATQIFQQGLFALEQDASYPPGVFS